MTVEELEELEKLPWKPVTDNNQIKDGSLIKWLYKNHTYYYKIIKVIGKTIEGSLRCINLPFEENSTQTEGFFDCYLSQSKMYICNNAFKVKIKTKFVY